MIALLSLSCSFQADDPLSAWPSDPIQLVQRCAAEQIPELQITCRVQAAAQFGLQGNELEGARLCQQISEPIWQEECHFRLGEELAVSGQLIEGLRHCSLAGRFTQNCLTHAIWRNPQSTSFSEMNTAQQIYRTHQEWVSAAESSLQSLPPKQRQAALDDLTARFGYSVYLGSGELLAGPAHLTGPLGAALRTGYAMEAARLLQRTGSVSVEQIVQHWSEGTPLQGTPQRNVHQQGRYYPGILSPFEMDVPKINLYGGGKRLIAPDPKEDLVIAALEALFWLEDTSADQFATFITHESKLIRWTAAKLLRLSVSPDVQLEGTYTTVLEEADPATRWHLEQQTTKKPSAQKIILERQKRDTTP